MQGDETQDPSPKEMGLTNKDLSVDGVEGNQNETGEQGNQKETVKDEKPLLQSWMKEYQKTNVISPMAPVATDTRIGSAVVSSVLQGESSWGEVLVSQLSEEQLDQVGIVTSKAHAAHSVPFIVEGYQENLSDQQLTNMRSSVAHYMQSGMPTETKAYRIDPELGLAVIKNQAFLHGWSSIKDRVFKAALDFTDNIPELQLEPPRADTTSPSGEVSTLTLQNAQRLDNFFSREEFQGYAEGLSKIYQEAADSINSEEGKIFAAQQRKEYDLTRGGKPGFRETPSLLGLVNLVDKGATKALEGLQDVQIPVQARNILVDVITRRKDQPTS